MENKELLRNLLVMAVADGSISQSEMQLLADRCTQWGVNDEEFSEMLGAALSDHAELTLPPDASSREDLLRELVPMMAADGQLARREKILFASAAAIMEISPDRLNAIIDEALKEQS